MQVNQCNLQLQQVMQIGSAIPHLNGQYELEISDRKGWSSYIMRYKTSFSNVG